MLFYPSVSLIGTSPPSLYRIIYYLFEHIYLIRPSLISTGMNIWKVNHFIPLTTLVPYTYFLYFNIKQLCTEIIGLLARFLCKAVFLKVRSHVLFVSIYLELCSIVVELNAWFLFSIFRGEKKSLKCVSFSKFLRVNSVNS